jgi:hypothetical protein
MHVRCPGCRRAIRLEPHEVGLAVVCAVCGRRFGTALKAPLSLPGQAEPPPQLPSPEPPPLPQEVHWHFTHVTAVQAAPGPPGLEEEQPPRRGPDAPGMISLVFGCVAGAFLLMACAFGITVFVAAPLALVGLVLAFFARGNLCIGALTLNLLVFVFAMIGAVIGVLALASLERLGRP